MTSLYIKIVDGMAVDHPILEENLVSAFPGINLDQLPSTFARFEKTPQPLFGVYELCEHAYAANTEGVYTDVWTVRPMTDHEKTQQQNTVKSAFIKINGPASWIFDEETCRMIAPVPRPEFVAPTLSSVGTVYMWDEATVSWAATEVPMLVEPTLPDTPQ